ncbi:hypothetical protein MNBD_GAMMA05-1709 [hydrothermal vent metagenome]|uniref:HPP transmembrane region domain-containing protein n=1 Tax=hydrothermal vent metagenome TaxID=652676 RepID=A0A3B0WB42_9ZZZZ
MKETVLKFIGIEQNYVGHTEKLVSALGGFLGIYFVFHISTYFLHGMSSYLILASMGSSAVLLFAVPHGPLSQPWPLVGGHVISAIIGVSCAKFIPDIFVAGSVAVGAAIGAMYYLRCTHPPGGATTLAAVIASDEMQQLGYQFVLTPVLVNVITILSVAIIFNYFFKWRRYPAYLAQKQAAAENVKSDSRYGEITHEDFVYALSEFESFIDISENDLLRIYDMVTQRHQSKNIQHHELKHGHYYSNGEYGEAWSIRRIIDWSESTDSAEEKLIYKVITGANRRNTGVMTKQEFSLWAKHEVIRDEDNWRRVDETK